MKLKKLKKVYEFLAKIESIDYWSDTLPAGL